jgi:hypothetical protein
LLLRIGGFFLATPSPRWSLIQSEQQFEVDAELIAMWDWSPDKNKFQPVRVWQQAPRMHRGKQAISFCSAAAK